MSVEIEKDQGEAKTTYLPMIRHLFQVIKNSRVFRKHLDELQAEEKDLRKRVAEQCGLGRHIAFRDHEGQLQILRTSSTDSNCLWFETPEDLTSEVSGANPELTDAIHFFDADRIEE